ncbi:MAG TPA: POTRA domain-containing protein [Candidatus Acidoferrum sp.]|nr:POTRA domain-containing protein [Candidatus Acidoferrum sp.]
MRLRIVSIAVLLAAASAVPVAAQTSAAAAAATAPLREIRADGLKSFPEAQIAPLTGLQMGAQVGKDDLQGAADKLVQSGLFATVRYNFQSRTDGLSLTFHLQEAPRVPVYFDNLPWFADSELNEAIRAKLPFYEGALPEHGSVVEAAADAVAQFLVAHGLQAAVEHQVTPNPLGDGTVQLFHINAEALHIAKIEFSDPALNSSPVVRQQIPELLGKPYSRTAIEVFLTEQIRPIFFQKGFLRVKLGPPEVRLTGDPNKTLPQQIPVYVPVSPGPVYRWKGVEWSGNNVLSSITLTNSVALKSGDVADGMAIEAAWDRVHEEYGRRGYLQAKVEPAASYDDAAHTVGYTVRVAEGKPFRFGAMTITGLSVNAERRLRDAWPIPPGELFDKAQFEDFLTRLQAHSVDIFKDLPVHYDEVGHWLQPDDAKQTVDVLLDFK